MVSLIICGAIFIANASVAVLMDGIANMAALQNSREQVSMSFVTKVYMIPILIMPLELCLLLIREGGTVIGWVKAAAGTKYCYAIPVKNQFLFFSVQVP